MWYFCNTIRYLQKHTVTAAQAWTTRGTQRLNWYKTEYKNLKLIIIIIITSIIISQRYYITQIWSCLIVFQEVLSFIHVLCLELQLKVFTRFLVKQVFLSTFLLGSCDRVQPRPSHKPQREQNILRLTFMFVVQQRRLVQRVEGADGEIRLRLPLLQDVLQELVQHVSCQSTHMWHVTDPPSFCTFLTNYCMMHV